MRRFLLLAGLLILLPLVAWAQVSPTPPFTPGHTVRCQNSTCTVISDAGPASGSAQNGQFYLTEIGITNTGLPFCINDALTNAVGGYHRICLGANSLGGGLISYDAVGGASPLSMQFEINGTTFAVPGTTTANVTASGTFVVGDQFCANNTTGTAAIDCGNSVAVSNTYHATAASAPCGQTLMLGGGISYTVTVDAATGYNTNCQITLMNTDSGVGKQLSIPGVAPFYQNTLFPNQTMAIRRNGSAWLVDQAPGPYQLPFQTTVNLYVNPAALGCGGGGCSDSNDGLTSTTAKLTSLGAILEATTAFEYACGPSGGTSAVVVNLLANEPNTAPAIHYGTAGTRGLCSGSTIIYDGGAFTTQANWQLFFGFTLSIRNVTIQSTTTNCMSLSDAQVRILTSVTFSCLGGIVSAQENSDFVAGSGFTVAAGSPQVLLTIAGGSHATLAGTITYAGNVTFTIAQFSATTSGTIDATGVTFSTGGNTITGVKALVTATGVLATATNNPNNDIPGTSNVQCNTGGQAGTFCYGSGLPVIGFVNRLRNSGLSQWYHGISTTITTSGGWGAEGVYIVPTGASVTSARGSAIGVVGGFYSQVIQGATGNTGVTVRWPVASYDAAPLFGQSVTFQFTFTNSSGGTITPTLTVKNATAQDNFASTTTDVSAASMSACTNSSTCVESYSYNVGVNGLNGISIDVAFGTIGNGTSITIGSFDFRETPGIPGALNAAVLAATFPIVEIPTVAVEAQWNQQYYGASYDNFVPAGTVTSAGENVLGLTAGSNSAVTQAITYPQMRCDPSVTFYSPVTGASGKAADLVNAADVTPSSLGIGMNGFNWTATPSAGAVAKIAVHHTRDCTITGG